MTLARVHHIVIGFEDRKACQYRLWDRLEFLIYKGLDDWLSRLYRILVSIRSW